MQTNVRGLACHSLKFVWRTVHLLTHNTFRDWQRSFLEIAVKTTRDYTALALRSGWTRTQTIFLNLTNLEAHSHRLGGRYDTKPLTTIKFLWEKKLHYWVPMYFVTDEYLSVQRCRINSTLISYGFLVVMQIKDSVLLMAVVTFSSTVKTVKWVEATV